MFLVNKLCISNRLRKRIFVYDVYSSLKELRWKAAVNRLKPKVSRIIPGNWGKAESGWLARPLLRRIARFESGGRIHRFLWRRSRAVSKREKGTERPGAMRNRSEPGQVAQESFGLERIAVTQRVNGCYCASARNGRLWRFPKNLPNERR